MIAPGGEPVRTLCVIDSEALTKLAVMAEAEIAWSCWRSATNSPVSPTGAAPRCWASGCWRRRGVDLPVWTIDADLDNMKPIKIPTATTRATVRSSGEPNIGRSLRASDVIGRADVQMSVAKRAKKAGRGDSVTDAA